MAPAGQNQIGNEAPDHIYRFTLPTACSVTFEACDSEFDTLLRVFSADGAVEYAVNDDDSKCCDRRDDREFRDSVNMHCPYSMVDDLALGAGEYLLVIEGYSNYAATYALTMRRDKCMGM